MRIGAVTTLVVAAFAVTRWSLAPAPADREPTAPAPEADALRGPTVRRVVSSPQSADTPDAEATAPLPLATLLAEWAEQVPPTHRAPDGRPKPEAAHYVTEAFLREDAVQAHLSAMSAAARAQALADIRHALGFPEEAIAAAAERDAVRQSKWDVGLAYMEARRALVADTEADQLDAALDALRHEHFSDRAGTIAREEASGFMRFERPRVFGVN